MAFAAGFIDIAAAAELTNIGTLFAFILVAGGVWWLRVKEPDRPRGFRVPLVSLGAMSSCFYLMLGLPRLTWERFGLWLALGLLLYFVYGRHRSALATAPVTELETAEAPPAPMPYASA